MAVDVLDYHEAALAEAGLTAKVVGRRTWCLRRAPVAPGLVKPAGERHPIREKWLDRPSQLQDR